MRFTVGGEFYEFDPEDIERAMNGQPAETIAKYAVTVGGVKYPPKQVFAQLTGRDRQSFTTMEAQRVLNRLGFHSYEHRGPVLFKSAADLRTDMSVAAQETSSAVDAELATIKLAIAELTRRVSALESGAAA